MHQDRDHWSKNRRSEDRVPRDATHSSHRDRDSVRERDRPRDRDRERDRPRSRERERDRNKNWSHREKEHRGEKERDRSSHRSSRVKSESHRHHSSHSERERHRERYRGERDLERERSSWSQRPWEERERGTSHPHRERDRGRRERDRPGEDPQSADHHRRRNRSSDFERDRGGSSERGTKGPHAQPPPGDLEQSTGSSGEVKPPPSRSVENNPYWSSSESEGEEDQEGGSEAMSISSSDDIGGNSKENPPQLSDDPVEGQQAHDGSSIESKDNDMTHGKQDQLIEKKPPSPKAEPPPPLPAAEQLHKDIEPVFENEKTAWDSLVEYLADKGIAKEKVAGWTVKVQRRGGGHVSTLYFNPKGKRYRTRGDIRRELQAQATAPAEISREEAYENAKQHTQLTLGEGCKELPMKFGDITVHELGEIHTDKYYHAEKHIWPVGFRAQRVEYCERLARGVKVTTLILEGKRALNDSDDSGDELTEFESHPVFRIEVDGLNGGEIEGPTPAEAWQRTHAAMSFSDRRNQELAPEYKTFFNLSIEHLIEGLPKALNLKKYIFHEQRGLGKLYFDEKRPSRRRRMNVDEEMTKALKIKERDVLQSMSKEDKERLREFQKLEKEKEKSLRKRQREEIAEERQRQKRAKEREKETQKRRRHEERLEKQQMKEKMQEKKEKRLSKHKQFEKEAKKLKKELMAELKKRKAEAKDRVLAEVDAEEARGEALEAQARVNEQELPDFDKPAPQPQPSSSDLGLDGNKACRERSWIDLPGFLPVWNFLHAFSKPLGLQNRVSPSQLLDSLLTLTKDCGEASEGRATLGELKEAEMVMDRVCMALVQFALPDLLRLLGISKENEGKNGEGDANNGGGNGPLPLNQLTWPELARQCLVGATLHEVLYNNTDEEVSGWVRGQIAGPTRDKQVFSLLQRGLIYGSSQSKAEKLKLKEEDSSSVDLENERVATSNRVENGPTQDDDDASSFDLAQSDDALSDASPSRPANSPHQGDIYAPESNLTNKEEAHAVNGQPQSVKDQSILSSNHSMPRPKEIDPNVDRPDFNHPKGEKSCLGEDHYASSQEKCVSPTELTSSSTPQENVSEFTLSKEKDTTSTMENTSSYTQETASFALDCKGKESNNSELSICNSDKEASSIESSVLFEEESVTNSHTMYTDVSQIFVKSEISRTETSSGPDRQNIVKTDDSLPTEGMQEEHEAKTEVKPSITIAESFAVTTKPLKGENDCLNGPTVTAKEEQRQDASPDSLGEQNNAASAQISIKKEEPIESSPSTFGESCHGVKTEAESDSGDKTSSFSGSVKKEEEWSAMTESLKSEPTDSASLSASVDEGGENQLKVEGDQNQVKVEEDQNQDKVEEEEEDEQEEEEEEEGEWLKRVLGAVASDTTRNQDYRCCASVLETLVCNYDKEAVYFVTSVSKWDYPDYHEIVARPVTFSQIATYLEEEAYGAQPVLLFERDVRQVFANCRCYNTEGLDATRAARKLAFVFERLMTHVHKQDSEGSAFLLLGAGEQANLPMCENCGKPATAHQLAARCRLCDARYHEECLPGSPEERAYAVDSEEWFCELCVSNPGRTYHSEALLEKTVTKWGGPAGLPPNLNPTVNKKMVQLIKEDKAVAAMHKALIVLSRSEGGYLPSGRKRAWTADDRLVVLQALCHLATFSEAGKKFLSNMEEVAHRLSRLITDNSESPASFNFQGFIREMGGEAAVNILKLMCAQQGVNASEDDQVAPGMCMVCHLTTFAEPDGTVLLCDGCDGETHLQCVPELEAVPETDWFCHPCEDRKAKEKDKVQVKKTKKELTIPLEEDLVVKEARRENEEALLEYVLDVRLYRETGFWMRGPQEEKKKGKKMDKPCGKCQGCKSQNCKRCKPCLDMRHHRGSGRPKLVCRNRRCEVLQRQEEDPPQRCEPPPEHGEDPEKEGPTCDYCGYAGLALCSPLVRGQTRAEALAHIEMFKKMEAWYSPKEDGEQRIYQVFLKEDGKRKAPVLPMPFWPLYDSEFAEDLPGPIVHEYCAGLMAQARAASQEHTLRKLKQEAVAEAIRLSGIQTHPLGQDRQGRQYWRLPWDNCRLYVAEAPRPTSFTTNLQDLVSQQPKWICYESYEDFQSLMDYMHPNGLHEGPLLLNIQSLFKEVLKKARRRRSENHPAGLLDRPNAVSRETSGTDNDAGCMEEDASENRSPTKSQRIRTEHNPPSKNIQDEDGSNVENMEIDVESEQTADKIVLLQNVPECTIPSTEVTAEFEDDNDETTEDGLFSFNSKGGMYYAAAIVDKDENVIRVRKAHLVFEIYRGPELVNSEICRKAWTDGVYYFSEVFFRRSGFFKLKFVLRPGTPPKHTLSIKPAVYEVTVTPSYSKTGAAAAVNRLYACDFMNARNRAIQVMGQVDLDLQTNVDEATSLRAALLAMVSALPKGSLSIENEEGRSLAGYGDQSTPPKLLQLPGPGEPWFWNSAVERVWTEKVTVAETCGQLLELLLVLESCLAPEWLAGWYRPLVHKSMPAEQCLRVGTPAIAALRLFLLDKALEYKKVSNVSRAKQLELNREQEMYDQILPQGGRVTRGAIAAAVAKVEAKNPRNKGRTTRTSQAAATSRGHAYSPRDSGRRTRNSQRQVEEYSTLFTDSDDSSDSGSEYQTSSRRNTRRGSRRNGGSGGGATVQEDWPCLKCHAVNLASLRRCEECNAFRPAAAAFSSPVSNKGRRNTRATRAKRKRPWDDSDEDNESEESDDMMSSSGFSSPRSQGRRPPPQRTRHSMEDDSSFTGRGGRASQRRSHRSTAQESDDESGSEKQFTSHSKPELESREFIIRCLAIIREVCDDETAELFLEPVDTTVYTTYRKHVKRPMDFQTISQKLKRGEYQSDQSGFIEDVRQIWTNCKKFNGPRAEITTWTKTLAAIAERAWTTYVLDDDRPPVEELFDHYQKCVRCQENNKRGEVVACGHCLSQYHYECLTKNEASTDSESWRCPDCPETYKSHDDSVRNPNMDNSDRESQVSLQQSLRDSNFSSGTEHAPEPKVTDDDASIASASSGAEDDSDYDDES